MKTALITGATSGIGKATAYIFAKNGIQLILCGRRKERLESIKNDLSKHTKIHCLQFDIRDFNSVKDSYNSLPNGFKDIDIHVNNAGNAHGLDTMANGDVDDWDNMIDSNIKGLMYISKMVIPRMIEREQGHIINIGSISGREVYAGGGVYCATKHAVDTINKGMRIELHKHNIRVGAINPGAVNTEFSTVRFKGDKERADNVYAGMMPLYADDIADIIHFVVTRPSHVNIADLLVLPTNQASMTDIKRDNL